MSSTITGLLSTIRDGVSRTGDRVAEIAKSAKNEAAEVVQSAKTEASQAAHHVQDAFEGAKSAVLGIPKALSKDIDRNYVTARDGFVAYDSSGQITGGRAPGATLRDFDVPASPLDPVLRFVNRPESGRIQFSLPGGATMDSDTAGDGKASVPLTSLSGAGLDAKRGGVLDVGVSTPGGQGDRARVLALPAGYDGPVFVCDIDDTLRQTKNIDVVRGKEDPPIDGARDLLAAVAKQGVPIVYLSAGTDTMHALNSQFLDQFPPGVLLDRSSMKIADLIPTNSRQADSQGDYKTGVLNELKSTFPKAQLFGLGDDKYGDASAYTDVGATAYIHDLPDYENLPADFHGSTTAAYTPDFIQQVSSDLQAAVQRSASFGGQPVKEDPAAKLSKILDTVTGTKLILGNSIEPLVDGEQALPKILENLDTAKKSVTYETYNLLPNDPISGQIVDRLIAAKARGVDVHVVLDAFGAREFPLVGNPLIDRLRQAGVPTQVYNPLDSIKDVIPDRDHRKTIVVDGGTAFVGGMNSASPWLGDPDVKGRWHDVFAKIQGPAVQEVSRSFQQSWVASGGAPFDPGLATSQPAGNVPMRIIAHVPGKDRNIEAAYLALINNAQTSINVENSFPMAEAIKDALVSAAQRGVQVRYVIGADGGLLGEANESRLQELLDAGVDIYVYPDRVHTKALSVDGKFATVGSSNLDEVSLAHDREIVSLIEDQGAVTGLDQMLFDRDVVGDPQGRQTAHLPKKLAREPFWGRVQDAILRGVWPKSLQ